jgi:hypothetical protein
MKERPLAALKSWWQTLLPGQNPEQLAIAEELDGPVIKLEGQVLVMVEVGRTALSFTGVRLGRARLPQSDAMPGQFRAASGAC